MLGNGWLRQSQLFYQIPAYAGIDLNQMLNDRNTGRMANAFIMVASLFCLSVNISDFVSPIIYITQYYD